MVDHYARPPNLIVGGLSHNGKPLIASMSGYNLLHAHYGGFVMVDNSGSFIYFFFPILAA